MLIIHVYENVRLLRIEGGAVIYLPRYRILIFLMTIKWCVSVDIVWKDPSWVSRMQSNRIFCNLIFVLKKVRRRSLVSTLRWADESLEALKNKILLMEPQSTSMFSWLGAHFWTLDLWSKSQALWLVQEHFIQIHIYQVLISQYTRLDPCWVQQHICPSSYPPDRWSWPRVCSSAFAGSWISPPPRPGWWWTRWFSPPTASSPVKPTQWWPV